MPTEVELLRVERSEQAKARAFWRSGIWLKILVAFQRDGTFPVKSHSNFKPYPFVALLLGFAPLFTSQNFDYENRFAVFFAQNDWLIVYFALTVN